MPRYKPPRCPACEKLMTMTGVQAQDEAPVWACPRCLTLYTRGKMKAPDTPQWVTPDRDAARRERRRRNP